MKKLIITMSIVLTGLLGYSQVTNVGEFRIADANTAFGINLPVGTKVYNIATGDYWVVTSGVASTATLATASASFAKLNDAGTDDQTATEVTISDAGGNFTSTTVEGALAETGDSIAAHRQDINQNIIDINTNTTNIAANSAAISAITDTDNQTLSIDSTGRVFTISILDGNSVKFEDTNTQLTETEVDNFVNNNGYLTEEADGSTTNELQNLTYNSTTHAVEIENGTSAVIPLASDDGATEGLASFTATDFNITSGNVAIDYTNGQAATNTQPGFATAAQITAIETNASNISTNSTDIASLKAIAKTITQSFEVASNSASATSYTLTTSAATSEACIVTYNGIVLDPTTDYQLASGTSLQINVPVYQYDKIVISYKTAL